MKHHVTVQLGDEIGVNEEWGYPTGITVGDMTLTIVDADDIGRLRRVLTDLETAKARYQREAREQARQAMEAFGATGPELAGFDREVA